MGLSCSFLHTVLPEKQGDVMSSEWGESNKAFCMSSDSPLQHPLHIPCCFRGSIILLLLVRVEWGGARQEKASYRLPVILFWIQAINSTDQFLDPSLNRAVSSLAWLLLIKSTYQHLKCSCNFFLSSLLCPAVLFTNIKHSQEQEKAVAFHPSALDLITVFC